MTTDPRKLGGAISGPGGPHDRDGVVLDTTNAIIADYQEVATLTNPSDGRRFGALLAEGRINRTRDRASVMLLLGPDGLAALATQAIGLAGREGGDFEKEFTEAFRQRMDEMP